MAKLTPLEDNVLVEPIEEEETTAGGLVLPDSAKEKPSKGKVVAVWNGKVLDNWGRGAVDVKEGDVVYFTKYSPDEISVNEDGTKKTYLIVRQSGILAKES